MQTNKVTRKSKSLLFFWILITINSPSHADVIMEWNVIARNLVVESKLYTPPANRVMAIVHTAINDAVNSITHDKTYIEFNTSNQSIALKSAVASASYTSLKKLLPKQQPEIETAYLSTIDQVKEGAAKKTGVKAGIKAADAVLNNRMIDGFDRTEAYRPHTTAGQYVPTNIPAVPHWPQRQTWFLDSAEQFRPDPPPALNSKQWAKDLNEVKKLGAFNSSTRTQEQTDIAKFWEATLPPIYHGVVHSVAAQKGRTVAQNAHLFALITQATDDAMIAVFDAKYHYALWRPITAIRNADKDGNNDTQRDATWKPYIPTPMHPEYPCAHCVVAGTVGAILEAEIGDGDMPLLTTKSDTANNEQRSWNSIESFVEEVSNARIYDGVHYRTSSEVGSEMGRKIGQMAVKNNQ